MMNNSRPEVPENGTTYKGHPQPPIDERLEQAKNFLADEDINRCLGFIEKLEQIEEYVKHIEDEKLSCDPELFGDVKIMSVVQREWIGRMDAPPLDTSSCDTTALPTFSTRLADAETAAKLKRQREREGLITQMREDHAPFTVKRSADQTEFLDELKTDAETRPDDVVESENLLYVEGQAYTWALNQPSLIPYWMHWDKGLPNKGIKQTDPRPWYRRSPPPTVAFVAKRPMHRGINDILPDYLLDRENEINEKLRKGDKELSDADLTELQELMRILEPDELETSHAKLTHLESECKMLEELVALAPEDAERLIDERHRFKDKFLKWLAEFRQYGVQIKVSKEGGHQDSSPGVFTVPAQLPPHVSTSLKVMQTRINRLLSQSRNESEEFDLRNLLRPFWPSEIKALERLIQQEATKMEDTLPYLQLTASQSKLDSLSKESATRFNSWIHGLQTIIHAGVEVTLKLRLPGQLPYEENDVLSALWPSSFFSTQPTDNGQTPPEVKDLENTINDTIFQLLSKPSPSEKSKLERELETVLQNVMYPRMRKMRRAILAEERKPGSSRQTELQRRQTLFDKMYASWLESLKITGIRIRMPPDSDFEEGPNILYYRGTSDKFGPNVFPNRTDPNLQEWAQRIKTAQRSSPQPNWMVPVDQRPDEDPFYRLLANLQYPKLKQLDLEWRELYSKPNLTVDDIKLREFIREEWVHRFLEWQRNLGHVSIVVPDPEENSKYPLGDPSVVYYRGPIEESPEDLKGTQAPQSTILTSLPPRVKQVQDSIRGLFESQSDHPKVCLSESDNARLETVLKEYWEPARLFYLSTSSPTQEKSPHARNREYLKRRQCFVEQCASFGFQIIPTPSHGFRARDWTSDCPEHWTEKNVDFSKPAEETAVDYIEVLNGQWADPDAFNQTISNLEYEINMQLREYGTARSKEGVDYLNRLYQLTRPFFPASLARMDRQIASPQSGNIYLDANDIRQSFHSRLLVYFNKFAYAAKSGWVKIRFPESDLNGLPEAKWRGVGTGNELHFTPRISAQRQKQDVTMNMRADLADQTAADNDLPIGFQRIEAEINILLKKHRAGILTFEDNDRLRTLMRTVMTPIQATFDDYLRALDEKWREGSLDPKGESRYIQMMTPWQRAFEELMDDLSNTGVKFVQVRSKDSASNSLVIRIDSPSDLPPDFRSCRKPAALVETEKQLNNYVQSKQALTDPLFDGILSTYWRSEFPKWKEACISKVRQIHEIPDNTFLGPEYVAEAHTALEYKVLSAVLQLKSEARMYSLHIKLYEWCRGVILLAVESGDREIEDADSIYSPTNRSFSDAASSGSGSHNAASFFVDDLPDLGDQRAPELAASMQECFKIISKVTKNTLSLEERKEAEHMLTPISETERNRAIVNLFGVSLKYRTNQPISDAERIAFKRAYQVLIGQNFAERNPELLKSFMPLPNSHSVDNLLKEENASDEASEMTEADSDEVARIAVELNNMLSLFQNGKLSADFSTGLDFLLRPLAPGDLADLYQQMVSLLEKQKIEGGLHTSESIALAKYTKQYEEDFQEWKMALPQNGIVLDDLYNGLDIVQKVVKRYRDWEKALESVHTQPPISPPGWETNSKRLQQVYAILKQYATTHGPCDGQEKLLLDLMPQPLQQAKKDLLLLLEQSSNTRNVDLGKSLLLKQVQRKFLKDWLKWFSGLRAVTIPQAQSTHHAPSSRAIDFTGKAERRGVQRAAVELALNLLATNQEQHRPNDKFRRVRLPPKYKPQSEEVPLWLPLEPWKRPVEIDPTKYTKIMRKYREWKDEDYETARTRTIHEYPAYVPAPENFAGPHTIISDDNVQEIFKQRQIELVDLQSALFEASKNAPRPLLHQLNMLIDESCRSSVATKVYHPVVHDRDTLTEKESAILRELAQPSWYEDIIDYPELIPGIQPLDDDGKEKLKEFERDLQRIIHEIPIWRKPTVESPHPEFLQEKYDPSTPSIGPDGEDQGWLLCRDEPTDGPARETSDGQPVLDDGGLLWSLNKKRLQEAEAARTSTESIRLWNIEEARIYLTAMHFTKRIFYDGERNLIARVPPTGHPENKYVLSRDDAHKSPHVRFNVLSNQYEVQYTACGSKGLPVIQPNKFEFLRHAAIKLGRDIGRQTQALTAKVDNHEKNNMRNVSIIGTKKHMDQLAAERGLKAHSTGFPNLAYLATQSVVRKTKDVSIRKMARDINQFAPDLAKEAGIKLLDPEKSSGKFTDRDAGKLVQMQILEEANNCWELRFPENEHVWDWASPRLATDTKLSNGTTVRVVPPQFFNMRRWPLSCQSPATQAKIKENTLTIQDKPLPIRRAPATTRANSIEIRREKLKKLKERLREEGIHTGKGRPASFTLGETPVQQRYMHARIERDLADVEEFYPRPDPPNWFQRNIVPRLPKTTPFLGHSDESSFDDDDGDGEDDDEIDSYPLPRIPQDWVPDSVSEVEKRHDVAETLMSQENFPDMEEEYFSPDEIIARQHSRDQEKLIEAKRAAIVEIENYCNMEWQYIKEAERREARVALDIDPVTEAKRVRPASQASGLSVKRGERVPMHGGATTARTADQPAPMMSGGLQISEQDAGTKIEPTRAGESVNASKDRRRPARSSSKVRKSQTAIASSGTGANREPPNADEGNPGRNKESRSPAKRAAPDGTFTSSSAKKRRRMPRTARVSDEEVAEREAYHPDL